MDPLFASDVRPGGHRRQLNSKPFDALNVELDKFVALFGQRRSMLTQLDALTRITVVDKCRQMSTSHNIHFIDIHSSVGVLIYQV